jgi:acetyl esterase/lipase
MASTPSPFGGFDIFPTSYKHIPALNHSIELNVLVPKNLTAEGAPKFGPRPLLVRYHGGGFIGASSLFSQFFAPWQLELATQNSAVIVTPDYRLIPESSVDELMEDIEDFWGWVHGELPEFIEVKTSGDVQVDTSRILVTGESAGGALSLLTGLNHPGEIKSVIAAYPMVDIRSPYYTEDFNKSVMGYPQVPLSRIQDHIAQVEAGELRAVLSKDDQFARADLMFGFIQRGLFDDYFPANKTDVLILDRLRGGARFPRGGVSVLHGQNDTVVPVEQSHKLATTVEEFDSDLKFTLTTREGEHGFDGTANLDDGWLVEALKDVVPSWLE